MHFELISIFDFINNGGDLIKDTRAYDKQGHYIGDIKSFNNYSTTLTNGRGGSNDYIHIKIKRKN